MDAKMALYHERCFPNFQNRDEKVTFICFTVGDRPPPWIRTCVQWRRNIGRAGGGNKKVEGNGNL